MPQVVRCQLILNPSAATRDQVMTTWHCVTVGSATTLAASTAFSLDLQTFVTATDQFLSSEFSTMTPFFRAWDLSDPKPRQPINEDTYTAMTTASDRAPRECCGCVSYKGTYLSGISPKSKRGRIYWGPIGAAALDTSTGSLSSTFCTQVAAAADALATASSTDPDYRWVIYSPTLDSTGLGNDPACWDAVTSGWVDNNVDIQRRRGLSTATRTLWSV